MHRNGRITLHQLNPSILHTLENACLLMRSVRLALHKTLSQIEMSASNIFVSGRNCIVKSSYSMLMSRITMWANVLYWKQNSCIGTYSQNVYGRRQIHNCWLQPNYCSIQQICIAFPI